MSDHHKPHAGTTNPLRRVWNRHEVDIHLQDAWLERLNALNILKLVSICEGHAADDHHRRRRCPHLILRLSDHEIPVLTAAWNDIRSALCNRFAAPLVESESRVEFELNSSLDLSGESVRLSPPRLTVRIEATQPRMSLEPETWFGAWFEQAVANAVTFDDALVEILENQQNRFVATGAYLSGSYVKFRHGTKCKNVLIDAVHAAKPKADKFTGAIVELVAEKSGCHSIIATVSREITDINRQPSEKNAEAVAEYRRTIHRLLDVGTMLDQSGKLTQPILHMAIHGMKDRTDADIELGTCANGSCSDHVLEWVVNEIEEWTTQILTLPRKPNVVVNTRFTGDISKKFHRRGDRSSHYHGYGDFFNTIQIEFSHWLREDHKTEIEGLLCSLSNKFSTLKMIPR